ncbi:MAG: gliding motility-associated C-terminal domain-containing protein [Pelagibacterales bacterium]|nr:gliding motility-associated C-terminal domain-containing protein [Pelagibacterales bacterium]
MKKILLNLLVFLFSIICFSQSIDLVRFDNSQTYNPGSGVSLHINPTGVFVLDNPSNLSAAANNAFHLELSASGGDFTNPTLLGTVHDFYTPLMNGVIPTGTASGDYKLRVRSTQPVTTVETATFTIDNSVTSALPTVQTTMQSNTNYFECLNDGSNTTNPYFGSLKQSYDAVTADMPSSYKFLQVTPSNSSYTLNVNLIDITAGTTTALTATSAGVYTIPDTLSVGAYNFEIEEVDSSGNSSFFSTTFLFHASATIFGNASSEIVCVGENVVFSIDITNLGIGSNYMASYYTFDFGDGTATIIKTQAELLADYTSPVSPITHIFSQASCSTLSTNFDIEMKLYNKGLSVGGTTPACDEYIANGSGATKQVTTSESPDANFVLNDEQCITQNITAINTSEAGSYPTPSGECTEEPNYYWYYKPPTATAFIPVFAGSPWLVGNNLIIPAADITVPGCWEIKLTAVNQDYCQQESEHTDTINIEDVPDADFNIIKDGQEVNQICVNDTVTLTDNSNIVTAACDPFLPNEIETYQWTISPNSGYTLQNSTTLNSENPEVTFTTEGNYTITETVTTECGSDSHQETLQVIGNPTVAFPVESQTYCSTSTLLIDFANLLTPTYSTGLNAPSSYTWTVTGTGITASDYSFANSTTASDALPTIQLNSFGAYSITVTLGSNCDTPVSDTVTISLGQTPIITNTTTSQSICSVASSTEFTTTADVSGTTFSWIATDNSNLSGYTSSGTTAAIPAQTITNNTNSDQDLVYTITPIADGCAGTPFEYTITVNPVPIIADKETTICTSGAFTITPVDDSPTEIVPSGTTYDWGIPVSSPVGAITGGSAANDQTSISQTLTNTTGEPATLTYTVTPDANGCKGDGFDIVVTVNPNGQVNALADQTLCNGDSTLAVTFATTNTGSGTTTYNWTNDNTAIGLASSGTGDISSFTATSSAVAPIVGNITVTPVYTYNDVSCTGTAETFSITVNPSPLVNFSEADQVIVTGETTTAVDLTSPTTDVTFAWTVSVPTGITGVTTLTGTDNIPAETLINSTTAPLDVVYTAIATGDVGFDCEGLPTDYTVTVNPQAQVNPVDDQVVCNDENLTIEFSTIVTGGTTTFSWTNDNTAIGLDATGTGNIDITAINTTDQPLTANIVVTPSFENDGDTNTGDSTTFTITVNPTGQVDVVGNQIVSNGFDTTAIAFSTTNVNGTTTYAWTNSITSIGLAASGTGNISAFTGINTGSSPVTSSLTVIPTFENGNVSCIGPATPFEITINPTAQVNPTDDMVVSDGDTVTIPFTTVNTGGTTTYTWTNTDPTTGLTTTGSSDIGFTAVNTGTSPITTTVVVTPGFENGGNSNTGPTDTFTITVNPTAQIDPIDSMVVCNQDNTTAVVFTTENTGGVTTYSWTNDNSSIGLASSGTGTIASFTAINTTTTAQVATIVVTPTFENGGNSNAGSSESFTITVNPTAQVNALANIISCDATSSGEIIFTTSNTDGATTYAWTNNNTSIGLAADGTGNISSFTLTNSSTQTQTATVTVTPTYTNNGVSCSGSAETFTITIPMGQVNAVDDQELCSGDQSAEVIFATVNTEGTTTYTWTNDNTSIGLSSGGTGNIPSFSAINSVDTAQTATIIVTPNYNYNGVVCTGPSETFTITVNPGAQVNAVDSQVLCNGDISNEVIFTTTNTDGTTIYNWTNDNTSIGLPGTGSGSIPAFGVVNTSNTSQTATITVTPTYENNGVVCIGAPESFTMTVNPDAQVDPLQSLNTVACDGDFTPAYIFTTSNIDGTTIYDWTNNNPAIGLGDSGSGGIPSFLATNSSNSTITATITVTPSYNNNGVVCSGLSDTFTITVNPSPQMDPVIDLVLCNNEISTIITFTSPNTDGTTTYNWTNDNTSIGLTASGTGDIPSFTATNPSIVSEGALITVTPTYENNGVVCVGTPETFSITVLSEIVVSGTPSDAVDCDNPNSGSVDLLVSGGSGSYTFLWSNGADTEDLSNVPAGDYTVVVTDSEGCITESGTFTIWRQDDLIVDLQTTIDPNCIGNFVSQINDITVAGGVPPYSINWSSGSVSIDDNTVMTAYENGTYTVLVTDSFGCQVETEIIVDFDELGDASFDLSSSGQIDCGISIFNELTFTNTSSGDYISVTWDFGDGSPIATGESVTYTYPNPGTYTITQTVEYSYGCSEVYTEEVDVTDGYDIVLPTAFSPNNDGMNDTMRPVYGCLNSIEMYIYDTFGSLIYYENNVDLIGWDGTLEGRKAENGNYLIVVNGVSIYQENINRQGVFTLLR